MSSISGACVASSIDHCHRLGAPLFRQFLLRNSLLQYRICVCANVKDSYSASETICTFPVKILRVDRMREPIGYWCDPNKSGRDFHQGKETIRRKLQWGQLWTQLSLAYNTAELLSTATIWLVFVKKYDESLMLKIRRFIKISGTSSCRHEHTKLVVECKFSWLEQVGRIKANAALEGGNKSDLICILKRSF